MARMRIRYEYRRGLWTCYLSTKAGRKATGQGQRKADAYRYAYDALYGPAIRIGPLPSDVRLLA